MTIKGSMCKARFVSQCFVFKSLAYKRECSVIARVRERKKERKKEREREREKERKSRLLSSMKVSV